MTIRASVIIFLLLLLWIPKSLPKESNPFCVEAYSSVVYVQSNYRSGLIDHPFDRWFCAESPVIRTSRGFPTLVPFSIQVLLVEILDYVSLVKNESITH